MKDRPAHSSPDSLRQPLFAKAMAPDPAPMAQPGTRCLVVAEVAQAHDGSLGMWANDFIESALEGPAAQWLDAARVRAEWTRYCSGASDNSFYIWQWLSAGMLLGPERRAPALLEALIK
jgi:hypothetical protein